MKKVTRAKLIILCLSLICLSISVSLAASAKSKPKLVTTSARLVVGKTLTIRISGATNNVKWSASNSKISFIKKTTKYAKVKALSNGISYIYAKTSGKKLHCKLSISNSPVSISKQSVSLFVGQSSLIYMKNTTKSVTWSSTNTKIATVSSGKITAKNLGSCYIMATVSGKKYSCQVTVSFSSTIAEKNISASYYTCDDCVVAKYTNNNKYSISLEPKMVFYDSENNLLSYSEDFDYCLESGKSCLLSFEKPDYGESSFDHYTVTLNSDESMEIGYTSNISVSANIGTDSLMATFTNNGNLNLDTIKVAALYFDSNGNPIGYDSTYAECNNAKSSDVVSFDLPYDSNYDTIKPASYQIFVNFAYQY